MANKVKSHDPVEAAIGRQGQALRRSCIDSRKASVISIASTADSSFAHTNTPLSRVASTVTMITEPDTEELIDELFGGIPRWQPGSFGHDPNSRRSLSYDNILGEGLTSSRPLKPAPSERQEGKHEQCMRLYGSHNWGGLATIDKDNRSYNELSLCDQRERIKAIQKAKDIQLVLHFPEWKTEYKGAGVYRMAADLPRDVANQKLIDAMGPTADLFTLDGEVELEGHDGTAFDDLLSLKFESEIQRKLQDPQEETVNGVKVIRGFPLPEDRKVEVVNVFHNPMTYAALTELQPWVQINYPRMTEYHFWAGQDHRQKQSKELNLVDTFPEPIHNEHNVIPKPVGFTNFAGPAEVPLPNRRRAMHNSDLEALKPLKGASSIKVPQKSAAKPIQITKISPLGARRRVPVPARPAMQRRTSDRGQKAQKASKKLGKKRVVPATEISQHPEPLKPVHSAATSLSRQADKAVATATATTTTASTDARTPTEYQDSPPAELLATSPTESASASTKGKLGGPENIYKASRNDSGYSSAKSSLNPVVQDSPPKSTQSTIQSVLKKPSCGSRVRITVPPSPPTPVSRSASVEKRNGTSPGRSQKRVSWGPTVVHRVGLPQAKAQPNSHGPYSSSRYVHVAAAKPPPSTPQTSDHPISSVGTAPTMKRHGQSMIAESTPKFPNVSDRGIATSAAFPAVPSDEPSVTTDEGWEEALIKHY